MEQRTPEWHEARKKRVTGSIVGAILGCAPYMTRADTMRLMVREAVGAEREFTGNVATEYGTANEANAIFQFEMETEFTVDPAPFVTCEDWLGASPDGYVSDGGLLEVKCPYGLRNDRIPAFKSVDEQPHYYAQMQVQMYVTGKPHCWFYQWNAHDTQLRKVKFDHEWIDKNLPVLRQFYAEFLHELEHNPQEHLAPKRVEIDTPEAHRMIAEWDELAEQAEQLAERKKDLLADLVRKLTLTERDGAISYAKAIKALCPDADLEPYRGKPSSFWAVR
jgi:putative phage-type endonuclease